MYMSIFFIPFIFVRGAFTLYSLVLTDINLNLVVQHTRAKHNFEFESPLTILSLRLNVSGEAILYSMKREIPHVPSSFPDSFLSWSSPSTLIVIKILSLDVQPQFIIYFIMFYSNLIIVGKVI